MYYLTSLTSVSGGPLFFLGTAEVMRQTFKEIQHREEAATSCNGGRGTPHSPTHTHTQPWRLDTVVIEVCGRGRQKALITSTIL